jgi:hypothetical protein
MIVRVGAWLRAAVHAVNATAGPVFGGALSFMTIEAWPTWFDVLLHHADNVYPLLRSPLHGRWHAVDDLGNAATGEGGPTQPRRRSRSILPLLSKRDRFTSR